tara:strand:- start:2835 stop:3221 length:387 start_codon:yes stop_codon:yes gene_type:complete
VIETAIKTVDGVDFITNIRILEADDTIGGFSVHRISDCVIRREAHIMQAIKAMGFKRVGRDMRYRSDLYAQFPIPYIQIKIMQFVLRVYWNALWWLYDNARMFKEVSPTEAFSWKYFTPYVWYKKVRK